MKQNCYTVEWHRDAVKQFQQVSDKKLQVEILNIIEQTIAWNPLAGKPLSGPFTGVRSYRVGIIRILYKAYKDRLVIVILRVDHRKNVYRLR
ncbi:MAG: type II toxin-antitoxin system mRNA interferase toxin, RelE/StbE family [Candidatus Omnitrophica bacterium]|nr:type II toxin-antitoxin system mRNA interferase toxin, RelE/StbE family [Candidatus Omnitrophota bacterium]